MNTIVNKNLSRIIPLLTICLTALFSVLYATGWTSWSGAASFCAVAVSLIIGLFRPQASFWCMIAFLPLEMLNILPESAPFHLRFYQLFAVSAALGYSVQFVRGKVTYKAVRFVWQDAALFVFAACSVAGAIFSGESEAIRLSIIVMSFLLVYGISRLFVRSLEDIELAAIHFFGAFFITVMVGIWQNWAFMHGGNHGELMPGRPNGVFPEADWFGIYMTLGIALALAFLLFVFEQTGYGRRRILQALTLHEIIFFGSMGLILSVARSAWLGAVVAFGLFFSAVFFRYGVRRWFGSISFSARRVATVVFAFLFAVSFVKVLHLTPFHLSNRLESSGTGLQKITVSCEHAVQLPDAISSLEDLEIYDCRHIPIEQITSEMQSGHFVFEVDRPDPNVSVRFRLWEESVRVIWERPWFGSGWGEIGRRLGADENGHIFNASNIFLEVWIGSGVFGFVAFCSVILSVGVAGIRLALRKETRVAGAGILVVAAAVIVPNVFNSGHLVGFFWVWMGISVAATRIFLEGDTAFRNRS